jgi:photosystem II stability/assembly factor-like uncharacterized protein
MRNSIIRAIILSAIIPLNSFAQLTGWEVVQSGTTQNLNSIYFYNHQFGVACGDSGVVLRSIDSGKTWQSLQSPVTLNLNDCVLLSEDCFSAVGDSAALIATSDGGNTWFFDQILDVVGDIYTISFARRDQEMFMGVYGADSQAIMTGDNFVASEGCSEIIADVEKRGPGGFWGSHMLTDKIGFVAGENSISQPIVGRNNDYPMSGWEFVSFYLDGNEGRAIGVSFTDSLNGYICAIVWDGRGAIAKTIDNGDNWTTTFFTEPLHGISFPISDTGQVGYSVGDSGTILKTYNAGETWYNQISGTSENLHKVYFVDNDFGFAVGDNGIILRTTNGGGSISSAENETTTVNNFELLQNYPNPFNPKTKIRFRIANFEFVSLKIYDVLGNEIVILVNEEKPVGSYTVEFNASNLPSGVYFYRLRAGSFNQIKKMILIK